MRFVVLSSAEYLPWAEMAMASIRHHHPDGHIVHMAHPATPTPEVADEAWQDVRLATDDIPRFLCTKFRLLADGGDEPTAVLDADTLTCKPLDSVWEQEFDVALAQRLTNPKSWGAQPYNSGVIFCRNAGFWRDLVTMMDSDRHWRSFGGDQQALAIVATSGRWKFAELPGKVWHNYEPSPHHFPKLAKVIHYKGRRRQWMADQFAKGYWKESSGVP